ncbi:DUF4933 domain-containing protein [Marinifilum flexuosum]|uniref:DUF4933 domain-containing protein n=1 Tax=Marinifilum flexuosum TaxID=1117708 RepID=UPI002492A608|nr:DUF4933 domain-containing protein [Marinifilum flexuosum]
MKLNLLLSILLIICFSCKNKSLKLNEKDLAQKILSEEDILAQKEELRLKREQELADSLAKLPKGFRFEAKREVDEKNPPIVIDIANRMDSIKEFKLSDVAQNIQYIKMQNLPDSGISNNMLYKYHMTDKYLVASNIYGIHLFTKNGKYQNTIIKNSWSGMKYEKKKDWINFYFSNFGAIAAGISVWSQGDNLYYRYQNTYTGQNYIMEVDCSKELVALNTTFEPENQRKIMGMGKLSVDLNHGHDRPFKARHPNGMNTFKRENYYDKINIFSPDKNTYLSQFNYGKDILQIFNTRGDTLSSFKKLEQLKNFKQKGFRMFDRGNSYELNGNYFFRTNYNDTIFKVIPPNIIQPKYVFHLGNHKVSIQDAMNSTFDLTGKIIPYEWADAKDYIFMSFIKDNNLCPKSKHDKSVKLHYAIYDKKNESLQFIKYNPTDYTVNVLQNDIDGGFSVWPKSYMINRKGEIMIALSGEDIKKKVSSDEFKNSTAPAVNKQKLTELAANCKNDDQVLMLVK